MYHVLDHAEVVYSGDLSQSTQYVIDHYDKHIDDAIRSGIKILFDDPLHGLKEVRQAMLDHTFPDFWKPVEDWELD